MIKLNLPAYRLRLRKEEGKPYIHDDLRQRFVSLTPEEWVRQHFVHYLMEHLGYPRELMMNEVTIQVGLTTKRCDTLLYSRQLTPRVLIEYKAPHIRITDRTSADPSLQLYASCTLPHPKQRDGALRLPD